MRILAVMVVALLLVGCESSQQSAGLTAAQAGTLALRLANDKADALFHHRPFQDGQLAQFTAGHWIWTDSHGAGLLQFQATVELAADGSTNIVDVKLLDDALLPMRTR
ncbi:MAG: hypothetical protein ACLPRE_13735 [Limisphaerales bacterium]